MKKKNIVIALCVILSIIGLGSIVVYKYYEPFLWNRSFDTLIHEEKNGEALGPYRGMYRLYGFQPSDDNTVDKPAVTAGAANIETESLALVEIRLINYRNRDISDKALTQIADYLDAIADSGKDIILRFLYDWDGGDIESEEPEELSGIVRHIEQVAPIVNARKKDIYIMQGVFAGLYAEMHGSKFTTSENVNILIRELAEKIDDDIFLAVRTPRFYRNINSIASTDELSQLSFDRSQLQNRISLYNDGMLGSDSDVGTYGANPFDQIDGTTEAADRDSEIGFQNVLCRFVPNGGEVIINNPVNDIPSAVYDLSDMHVSYVNDVYDPSVLDKWKNSTYTGSDYKDYNAYEYIRNHLGYRFVVSTATWESGSFPDWKEKVSVEIKNDGFSNFYRDSSISFLLEGEEDLSKELDAEITPCDIGPQDKVSISAVIDKRELPKGNYRLSIRFHDDIGDQDIPFANKGYQAGEYYTLGTYSVE